MTRKMLSAKTKKQQNLNVVVTIRLFTCRLLPEEAWRHTNNARGVLIEADHQTKEPRKTLSYAQVFRPFAGTPSPPNRIREDTLPAFCHLRFIINRVSTAKPITHLCRSLRDARDLRRVDDNHHTQACTKNARIFEDATGNECGQGVFAYTPVLSTLVNRTAAGRHRPRSLGHPSSA